MKKLFAVLMAMAMVVSMAACAAPRGDGSRSLCGCRNEVYDRR